MLPTERFMIHISGISNGDALHNITEIGENIKQQKEDEPFLYSSSIFKLYFDKNTVLIRS